MRTAKSALVVSEREIEDILATCTDLLAELLGTTTPLRVLARQLELPDGGRLDMLCLAGDRLHLVELKVEPARPEFVRQTAHYINQVSSLQVQGMLPQGIVDAYLLAPRIPTRVAALCAASQVKGVVYSPQVVLTRFYHEFYIKLPMHSLVSHNHGVWHLGVTNPIVAALAELDMADDQALARFTGLASSTVRSYLTLLQELGLVESSATGFRLTSLGKDYAQAATPRSRQVSEDQATILRNHILRHPFASGVSLGICTAIESTVALAKNQYPVLLEILCDYFTLAVGNQNRWNSPKTRLDATRMYVEYAAQLGLLARVGNAVYLTPEGMQFHLMLQMHKAIQLLHPTYQR